MFIVFEGPEGGGKTSQIRRLAKRLTDAGLSVVSTFEPGGTGIGQDIRSLLLGIDGLSMYPETEALLLAAARAQNVREVIWPALESGAIVLCDRFVDSTYAYQGGGRQLSISRLRTLQEFATGGLLPDFRVLLDIPVEEGLARRGVTTDAYAVQLEFQTEGTFAGRHDPNRSSVNRLDMVELDFHKRVRRTYLELAREDPSSWIKIDARKSESAVERQIWHALRPHLNIQPKSSKRRPSPSRALESDVRNG